MIFPGLFGPHGQQIWAGGMKPVPDLSITSLQNYASQSPRPNYFPKVMIKKHPSDMEEIQIDQGQRLLKLIKALKTNQTSFARSLGMTQSNISRIISGENKLSGEVLIRMIQNHKGVNLHWLLTGEGSMFLLETPAGKKDKVEEPAAGYEKGKTQLLYREVEAILELYARRIESLEETVARLEGDMKKLLKRLG
jgi:transcriptional regulator with XRE-family HTH domain